MLAFHYWEKRKYQRGRFESFFQVNVKGSFLCIQAALPKLKQEGAVRSIGIWLSVAATIGILK